MSAVETSANRPLALATVVILVLATGIGIYWYQFILTPPPTECERGVKTLDLTAKQWAFEPRALVVCDGDTVVLRILATLDEDPEFDRHGFMIQSIDGATVSGTASVLPKDEVTEIQFVAEKSGTAEEKLRFFCTIFCGEGHSAMSGQITVL